MAYEDKYSEFEQYLRAGEPDVKERARNWSIAIGLQDVDGLKPSEFLLSQVKENIEGKITADEVRRRIEEYYSQRDVRAQAEANGTLEADVVSQRINDLLSERAFTFSPAELTRIHKYLFQGILEKAGQFRTFNITKNQWILDGESIAYGSVGSLTDLLNFDFAEEKKYDYSNHTAKESIAHIVRFISGVWQIHAFAEGNTRTTAVFLIKYLNTFGFEVNNESFAKHSWFFRNTLVRSQYENIPKGIHRTFEPIERFLNFAVFGTAADLRNRTLHIRWKETDNDVLNGAKRQNDVLKTSDKHQSELSLKEMAVIRMMVENPRITITDIAQNTRMSKRTVDRIISSLKERNLVIRTGPKNNAKWLVKTFR